MERLWTKSFIQMTIAMLFLFTGFYLLVPTLPLFIKEIGGNESQVGLMMGMFTIAAVVIRPIIGGMLDQYGRRSFIIFGLIFFGITMYSYNLASTIVLLAVLRVIHGVTWAVSTTAVGTAITDIIPDSRRGEGMGWYDNRDGNWPDDWIMGCTKLFISWSILVSNSFILYGSRIIVNNENTIHATKTKRENSAV